MPDLTDAAGGTQHAARVPRAHRARLPGARRRRAAPRRSVGREFSRTERLLIRFDVYAAGTDAPTPTAALLNRSGQKMADVPVAPAAAGGTHAIDLGLNAIPAGEYLIEIDAAGASGKASEVAGVPRRSRRASRALGGG